MAISVIFFISNGSDERSPCKKPYVTFTFDDGYEDQYTAALQIFEKHNVSATLYVITGLVGSYFEGQKLMGWNQIYELQKNGLEIGSHTVNHKDLSRSDKDEIKEELATSKRTLIEKGFDARTLSVPYGIYNENIEDIAKQQYDSIRVSVWGPNNISELDEYRLKSFWMTNKTLLEDMKKWIDETKEKNYWTIITIHHVRENKTREYTISPEDLEELIIYTKQKGIEIRKLSEVLDLGCNKRENR